MTDESNAKATPLIDHLKTSPERCPECRYTLTGLTSDRCPECGTLLRLQVIAQAPSGNVWWWMGLLGCILTTGLAARMLFVVFESVLIQVKDPSLGAMVRAGIASPRDLADWRTVLFGVVCALGSAAALAWLFAVRKRFSLLPIRHQRAAGLLGLFSTLLLLGLIFVFVNLLA